MGYGSDLGQRHTPWIVGGMAVLAVGGLGAASAVALLATHFALGIALAIVSFAAIGAGVSACGTSLLVLMAKRVAPEHKAAAATTVWMMMIAGFAVTATVAGKLLDPFSPSRLIAVAGGVSGLAFLVAAAAMWGVERVERDERERHAPPDGETGHAKPSFRTAFAQVWSEPNARRFTVFVFVSMLAYSAQDLILEPFAGSIFSFTPGESTKLSGAQHGGVFAGMLLVAIMTSTFKRTRIASLKAWVVGGCLASSLAMAGLVLAGLRGVGWPLQPNVFLLGLANGIFSIAAISSMMTLAGRGRQAREGTRMGLWGAAQAIAFGLGGFVGTVLVDGARRFVGPTGSAYAFVFGLEAVGFFAACLLALGTSFSEHEAASPVRDRDRAVRTTEALRL
jgi:BCD family chlorophyll transporter-like MFS transporter